MLEFLQDTRFFIVTIGLVKRLVDLVAKVNNTQLLLN